MSRNRTDEGIPQSLRITLAGITWAFICLGYGFALYLAFSVLYVILTGGLGGLLQ